MDIYKKQRQELNSRDYFWFIDNELLDKLDICDASVVAVPFPYEEVPVANILDICWKGDIHFVVLMSKQHGWYYVMRDGQKISNGYHFGVMKECVIQKMQQLINDVASGKYNNKKTLKEQVRTLIEERSLTGYMNATKWKELLGAIKQDMKDIPLAYKTLFDNMGPTEFWTWNGDEYIEYMDMVEVEWFKFQPVFVRSEYCGRLVAPEVIVIDYEKQLLAVFDKYNIPYEYDERDKTYTVYGYR